MDFGSGSFDRARTPSDIPKDMISYRQRERYAKIESIIAGLRTMKESWLIESIINYDALKRLHIHRRPPTSHRSWSSCMQYIYLYKDSEAVAQEFKCTKTLFRRGQCSRVAWESSPALHSGLPCQLERSLSTYRYHTRASEGREETEKRRLPINAYL